jgi:hypothetical protein
MNTTGKKYGGRKKGTPNKVGIQVKQKLALIINETINSIDINELSINQQLKLLQLGIPYVVSKAPLEIESTNVLEIDILKQLNNHTDKQIEDAIDNQSQRSCH